MFDAVSQGLVINMRNTGVCQFEIHIPAGLAHGKKILPGAFVLLDIR